jgi:hypothetical protein
MGRGPELVAFGGVISGVSIILTVTIIAGSKNSKDRINDINSTAAGVQTSNLPRHSTKYNTHSSHIEHFSDKNRIILSSYCSYLATTNFNLIVPNI